MYQLNSNRILRTLMILNSILIISVYFIYRTDSWPAGLEASGCLLSLILMSMISLLLWTMRNKLIDEDQKKYVTWGLGIGLLWSIEISINNFIRPGLPQRDIADDIFWAIVALLILIASIRETYRSDKFKIGLKSGFWTGFASGTIACITALIVIVFGMRYILLDSLNIQEWADRKAVAGTSEMSVYFAYQSFAGAIMHLFVLGIGMGLMLGGLGSVIGWTLRKLIKK